MSALQKLVEACEEALDFVKDRADVIDGPDGKQRPNREMRIEAQLRAALAQAEAEARK